MPAAPLPNDSPLTVLVDDVRDFKDQRPALVARSSPEALRLLDELEGKRIDHLWLDHDLTGKDTIAPVVDLLVHRARSGSPLNVGQIHIHTVNIGAGLQRRRAALRRLSRRAQLRPHHVDPLVLMLARSREPAAMGW